MRELKIVGLSKTYRSNGKAITALEDVSLNVRGGEIVSVLGLNGAGKTTLVKTIAGLIEPDKGSVQLDDADDPTRSRYRKRIGAVFEGNRNIYWRLTAFENLEYFGVLRGLSLRRSQERARQMLSVFQLESKRSTIAAHLSRGMQQRLAVAISMVHEPELLVLDEPTLGVDIENVLALVASLKELSAAGVAIVVTSHQFDVVKMVADRIALIVAGKLVALESKADFIASVNKGGYSMQVGAPLDAARMDQLRALGVRLEESWLHFPEQALYAVIDIVRPSPITSLNSMEDDLTKVFLERIKDYAHA
ncbi:ABC transporter ATP-binding protein [Dyella choica]|uniref:ABC transporter ATP-binding protein n=1 Tax=Dyella choica TaxID=1927959 RepID=A0A3S0RWS7_9GAMM|nr:ABC transporter ATP-binding protein [Dyella choica]RUL69176.1 ABC transporter ATP-binding protein [Dyella choica]